MLLNVDCLPNAVGKQPSIPLINLGRKWTLSCCWWWWRWAAKNTWPTPSCPHLNHRILVQVIIVTTYFENILCSTLSWLGMDVCSSVDKPTWNWTSKELTWPLRLTNSGKVVCFAELMWLGASVWHEDGHLEGKEANAYKYPLTFLKWWSSLVTNPASKLELPHVQMTMALLSLY